MSLFDTIFETQSRSHVLLLAIFASTGLVVGTLWVERVGAGLRRSDLLYPAAAGVLFATAALAVTPFVQSAVDSWAIPVLFLLGGGAYVLLCKAAGYLRGRFADGKRKQHDRDEDLSNVAVSSIFSIVDLIGYGLTLGIAAAASVTLAIVTAAGLAMANVLVSRQIGSRFIAASSSRMDRIALQVGLALAFIGSALLAFWMVHSVDSFGLPWLLTVLAGLLLAAAVRALLLHQAAHTAGHFKSLLVFLVGFALLALIFAGLDELSDAVDLPNSGLEHPAERPAVAFSIEPFTMGRE